MNNFIAQRVSQLETQSVKFNLEIPDEFFTQRSLTDFAFRDNQIQALREQFK
jgi:hypothetical protein